MILPRFVPVISLLFCLNTKIAVEVLIPMWRLYNKVDPVMFLFLSCLYKFS